MKFFNSTDLKTKNGKTTQAELAANMIKLIKKYKPAYLDRVARRRRNLHKQGIRPTYASDKIKCKFVNESIEANNERAHDYSWDMKMMDAVMDQDMDRASRIPSAFMAATMRVVGDLGNSRSDLMFANAIEEEKLLLGLGYAPIHKELPPVLVLEYKPTFVVVRPEVPERIVIDLTDE